MQKHVLLFYYNATDINVVSVSIGWALSNAFVYRICADQHRQTSTRTIDAFLYSIEISQIQCAGWQTMHYFAARARVLFSLGDVRWLTYLHSQRHHHLPPSTI